uniref:Protein MON2 homolog n=1 Tax=Petromyzon marinus TaxID=7757 RepID=S4RGZ0_PETMA
RMATTSPEAVKKLIEHMQSDLRALSMDCKKKYPPVKEAAESGIVKIKTIAGKNKDILKVLKENSAEVVQPLLMGCGTKEPKIALLCLTSIQRLLSHDVVSEVAAVNLINTLWQLMENGLEELKLLQTVLVLLTSNTVVHDESLAKAIVLCFRLHFTKDNITNNTAAATVRQVVTVVFERMVAEDQLSTGLVTIDASSHIVGNNTRKPPTSLKPCAKDAYLLFQDLCQLVNADAPFWLVGMTEMTRTFGLELLESVLNTFPQVFLQHMEFAFLLKERVCPLVIKLFSPNIKFRHTSGSSSSSPGPSEKPYFPICMRLLRVVSILIKHFYSLLVTECEIFLSLLVKFLDGDKPAWLRALAGESLHRLCIQPRLLRCFCQSYDMKEHSTKVFRDIINALGSFIQSLFINSTSGGASSGSVGPPTAQTVGSTAGTQGGAAAAGGPMGGVTPQPAFEYRGVWIPILSVAVQGTTRSIYLEMLDKVEAPSIPDGYSMSVAFSCLLDLVRGVTSMIEAEMEDEKAGKAVAGAAKGDTIKSSTMSTSSANEGRHVVANRAVWEEMVNASWCGLLAALSLLLDASTDETATENILKAETAMAALSGKLHLKTPRDAFITAVCKASLPPHYALTGLNTTVTATVSKAYSIQGQSVLAISPTSESHQQVVAMGQPLSMQVQGTVVLTSKNMQSMRTLLNVAHCHGAVLGSAWQLVLSTLQHLVWILGLKPAAGGALKPGRTSEGPSTVLTTAVMADLPVISNMLSRLFESSQYLDDVSLHHLINALCSLSSEAMEMAYGNSKEPSLFAVAKLLETGLVNMHRIEILWRPLTGHLLEVCQHPNVRMREWGAEAITSLIKEGLAYTHTPPLSENQRLQAMLLLPLRELSSITHGDIRQKQLECMLQLLESKGESLGPGWPLLLAVIGAIRNDQGESLIRTAFQCLQLVVTDFLPTMPSSCLRLVVEVAGSFGLQNQELNISLTSIGLLWNISDYFSRRREIVERALEQRTPLQLPPPPPFEQGTRILARIVRSNAEGEALAVHLVPRKECWAVAAYVTMAPSSLPIVQVLFPLLDKVRESAKTADKEKIDSGSANILIHHSRDTAEKQWAETWVLALAGVARIFNTRRKLLKALTGDFSKAWNALLDHIQAAALSRNGEVSLAALKSFQEILQIVPPQGREGERDEGLVSALDTAQVCVLPLPFSVGRRQLPGMPPALGRSDSLVDGGDGADGPSGDEDAELWWAAWLAWVRIGGESTQPPCDGERATFVPSQLYLAALVHIFPALFRHVRPRFGMTEMRVLGVIMYGAVSVPISSDVSPFLLPSFTEAILTALQEAVLGALTLLQKAICTGPESMQAMYPAIFQQLLKFVAFACVPPQYGKLETKNVANAKYNQAEWVAMNYVPFAERALELVVELYQKTACHKAVVNENVLQEIIKTLRVPLSMKYTCPSESTWRLAVTSLLRVLAVGLPVARQHASSGKFDAMWSELAATFQDFLFTNSTPPENLSLQEFQKNESIDVQVVQLIGTDILPHALFIPKEFVNQIMSMLNKGSIHSQSTSFTEAEVSYRMREEFSKVCFETLLQFSLSGKATSAQEGYISRMALAALLQRAQQVLAKYVEDERLSGSCPLPRQRITEVVFVLKATSTLMDSLKKTRPENVDMSMWEQVIALYPTLVACVSCTCPDVCLALQEAMHPFQDMLRPPPCKLQNGTS